MKVWLGAHTIDYPTGGGHLWVYLNWALGLRESGCEVVWLEAYDGRPGRSVESLRSRLRPYGLAD